MHSPFKETLHSQTTFLTQNVLHGRLLAASGKAHLQKGVLKREHNSLRLLSFTTWHPIEVQAKLPPPRARFASNPLCVHTYGMPNRAQQESLRESCSAWKAFTGRALHKYCVNIWLQLVFQPNTGAELVSSLCTALASNRRHRNTITMALLSGVRQTCLHIWWESVQKERGASKKTGRCKIAESKLGCVITRDVNSTLHSQCNASLERAFLERCYA